MFDPASETPVLELKPPAARPRSRLTRWLGQLAPPPKDWALWQRACGGDAESAAALVRLLTPQALGLAMQLLRQRADAEDVVQESFLRLWSSRPSDSQGATLATYFNTIVINRCRSLLTQRRELATEPEVLAELSDAQQPALTAEPQGATHQAERLRQALHTLPARQRMALAMWAYADASVPEIAAALEIDSNAAHQLLHRAKQTMKLRLAQGEPS
jgi:RNA polymerase sigma-70 factor (ECF subfamily)